VKFKDILYEKSNMRKIDAIAKVMEDNGGVASLNMIYNNITKYYPTANKSESWQDGIRGVLYREIKNNRMFKKIGIGIYALTDYDEETRPAHSDSPRMHSYMEGICIELGSIENYETFTADPSASFRDNIYLRDIASIHILPPFTYSSVLNDVKRIDVMWFSKGKYPYPKKVFEIVDSISTLNSAFNRTLRLKDFQTKFYIVAPEKHHEKFCQTLDLEVYESYKERFSFINYDDMNNLYESSICKNELESRLLG
jgi:hypothetical protein